MYSLIKLLLRYNLSFGPLEFYQAAAGTSVFGFSFGGCLRMTLGAFLGFLEVEVLGPGSLEALVNVLPSFDSEGRSHPLDLTIDDPELKVFRLDFLQRLVCIEWHQRSMFEPDGAEHFVSGD
jgi:hypothetical protein